MEKMRRRYEEWLGYSPERNRDGGYERINEESRFQTWAAQQLVIDWLKLQVETLEQQLRYYREHYNSKASD